MVHGLPKILSVRERLKPLQGAATAWVTAATELSKAGNDLAQSFKDQALCISGQLAAAANMIGKINTNISVSVEVSVSASATASGAAG